MKNMETKDRVWEIDALRGYFIFWVLIYHLYTTVYEFCTKGCLTAEDLTLFAQGNGLIHAFYYIQDGAVIKGTFFDFMEIFHYPFVDGFFIFSGIACMFSRNNLKRALKVLGAGLFISAFTFGLWKWTGDPARFIRFGVLMCYACCQLIYIYLLEKRSNEFLFIVSALALSAGYYLRYHGVSATNLPIFYIFGVPQIGDQSSDWWPILPMLGWFLLGVVIGRKYYPEKKTLIPSTVVERLSRPLQWLGRWSGVIYVSHIVIYTAVFCGIGYIFHLL